MESAWQDVFGPNSFVGNEVPNHKFYIFNDDVNDFRTPYVPSNNGAFFLPEYASETRKKMEGVPKTAQLRTAHIFYDSVFESFRPEPDKVWFRVEKIICLNDSEFQMLAVYNGCIYLKFQNADEQLMCGRDGVVMLPFRYMFTHVHSSKPIQKKIFETLVMLTTVSEREDIPKRLMIELIAPHGYLGLLGDMTDGWKPLNPIVTSMSHCLSIFNEDVKNYQWKGISDWPHSSASSNKIVAFNGSTHSVHVRTTQTPPRQRPSKSKRRKLIHW